MSVVDAGGLTKSAAGDLAKAIESHLLNAGATEGWRVTSPAKQHGRTAGLTVERAGRRVGLFIDASGAPGPTGEAEASARPDETAASGYTAAHAAWDAQRLLRSALVPRGGRIVGTAADGAQLTVAGWLGHAVISIRRGGD